MDDDYDYYSGDDEFNEDSLTNEEYDALYAALPQVKTEMASYNPQIEDLDIKEALHYNYYDISAAIAELKSKFPKKKDEPLPPKKLSKLALLAKLRGDGAANDQSLKSPGLDSPAWSPEGAGANRGKISRLAALARARSSKRNSIDAFLSGINDASASKPSSCLGSQLSALAKEKPHLAGLSALGKLRKSSESQEINPGKPQLTRKSNRGGLELRRKLENAKKAQQEKTGTRKNVENVALGEPMDLDEASVAAHILKPSSSGLKEVFPQPQLSFELSVDHSGLFDGPRSCVSVLLFENGQAEDEASRREFKNKRRRVSSQIFCAYTNRERNIAKARSHFSLPSPDDKVLSAQRQAFEQSIQDLSIKDEAPLKSETKTPVAKQTETKPFKKIDVKEELAQNPHFTKPNVSFVIIGHVDAGKSTLMGRILYDLGTVDAKTVNKLVREAEKSGKGSFALAWVMDQTSEERARGVTIDICATTFETSTTRFTAIDAPGHKDFVPQMIGGVCQADTALLVVDSITGEFEAGFLMDGQTKEHAIIAKSLGIDNLCVAINKLDKENWSQSRFEDIKVQLGQFLTGEEIGFSPEALSFVPISGLTGCNVVKNDHSIPDFSWYKGPTLLKCLQIMGKADKKHASIEDLFDRDFTLAINDIYDVTNSEFKIKGKISLGMVQPGETICIHPTEDVLQIQSVQFNGQPANVAVEGQIVSLAFKVNQLKNKSTDDLAIGDIVLSLKSSVRSVKEFQACVNTFNMTKPLLVGTPFVLFRNNAAVAARINKVIRTNGKKKKMHVVSRQSADIVVEVLEERKLPVSRFDDNKSLGRIVLRREGITIGAGTIQKLE